MKSLMTLTPILSGEKFFPHDNPPLKLSGASLTREIQYHGLAMILSQAIFHHYRHNICMLYNIAHIP